jgi:hypothetical protein
MAYGYHPTYPPTRVDLGPGDVPTPKRAPASVRVAAAVLSVTGLALLAIGALAGYASLAGPDFGAGWPGGWVSYLDSVGLAGGAVYVFAGLVLLAFGRRIRRGGRFARAIVVGVSALTIGSTLYTGLVGPGGANALLGLVVPVSLLVLLYLPAARSWYRDRTY